MKRFLLLYSGPPAPPNPSHRGWPEWFEKTGDAVVEVGSPMKHGFVVRSDGSTHDDASRLNGYCVIQAEDRSEVVDLVKDHPLLALGDEHSIEIFEVPRR
jgi:hypothetical protein